MHIPMIMSLIVIVLGVAMFLPAGESAREKNSGGKRGWIFPLILLIALAAVVVIFVKYQWFLK